MAEATLFYLTYIVVILLLGLLSSFASKKFKVPNVLLLLIAGILLRALVYGKKGASAFSPLFLTGISIIALVMIVFNSSARWKFREFDKFSIGALKLVFVFLLLNLLLLTPATMLTLGFPLNIHYLILAMIFSAAMSGTDTAIVLSVFKGIKNKVAEFLEVESLLNTPIMVLIPFILLGLVKNLELGASVQFAKHVIPFLTQFVAGIGAGVLIGLVMFKVMRKYYSEELSPLVMVTSALLTYILAENIGGNGVLAVTAMGLIFGGIYVKQKIRLMEFSSIFSNSLEILVFVLLGFVIALPYSLTFFIKTFALFIFYVFIRYLSIHLSFKAKYAPKEKLFMSLAMPKGIAVAVVAFALSAYSIEGLSQILNIALVFILYSIITASIAIKYAVFFVKTPMVKTATPVAAGLGKK